MSRAGASEFSAETVQAEELSVVEGLFGFEVSNVTVSGAARST